MTKTTVDATNPPQNQSHSARLNPASAMLFAGLILLLLWLGLKGWRVATAANALLDLEAQATSLLDAGPTNINPDNAAALVTDLRTNVVILRDELNFLLPITSALGWVPRYGSTLVAAPQLMEMADAGSAAAAYAYRGLAPALPILQSDGSLESQLPELLAVIDTARPDLIAAHSELTRLATARAALLNEEALPWRLRSLLPTFDIWLPRGQDGLLLAQMLPEMLGANGSRTYLLIAQNEDEMRATGGFISGVGTLTLDNGRIAELSFEDASLIDDYLNKPYGLPPAMLEEIMGIQLFLFRDANFWPDFPTSADKMLALYSYGKSVPQPDGIIAFDQTFVQMFLTATGPIEVIEEETDTRTAINANNVVDTLRFAWAPAPDRTVGDWVLTRKDFLADFAGGIRQKLESDLGSIDLVALATQVFTAVDQKNLQLYLSDPQAAAVLQEAGWDGRLPPRPQHDFLMFVDTNMGYNKVNLFVNQAITYDIEVAADGSASATAALTFTNDANPSGPDREGVPICFPQIYYDADPSYLEMADTCHVSYLRLYTPPATTLIAASRHVVPAESLAVDEDWDSVGQPVADLPGFNTFANVVLTEHQSQATAVFTYTHPAIVQILPDGSQQYRLDLLKQAGTRPFPAAVTITLPDGATLLNTSHEPVTQNNQTLTFELILDSDSTLLLHYQMP